MPPICAQGISNSVGIHGTPPQGFVRVNGALVVVNGTPVADHGDGVHNSPVTANGASFARINGIPINRNGDRATCGHQNANGFAFCRVGGASGSLGDYGFLSEPVATSIDYGSITDPPGTTADWGTIP